MRKLFSVPPGQRTRWSIVFWWEFRRCVYLPFVMAVGFAGVLLITASMPEPPQGEEGFEPVLPMMLGLFGSQVCYTGGWMAELVARALWKEKALYFGPVALSLGLIFTFLVCIPVPLLCALFSI
jgi:hypothetical protein